MATPILLRPIEYGADIVVHSLTKFMGGHGTTLGGAIVDSGRFPWAAHADRFPMFYEPDASYHGLVYTEHFGAARLYRALPQRLSAHDRRGAGAADRLPAAAGHRDAWRCASSAMSRTRAASPNSCASDPRVAWVNYAGFADNPYHALAQKYLGGRACSLLTFGIAGGLEAGKRFYDALKLFKRLVNMGDAKSLACHPASTTHRQMSAAEQAQGRRAAGDDPAQRRHRAYRRHHRRSRPGARRGAAAQRSPLLAAE